MKPSAENIAPSGTDPFEKEEKTEDQQESRVDDQEKEVFLPLPDSEFVAVFNEKDLPPFIKKQIDSFQKMQTDLDQSRQEREGRGEEGSAAVGPDTTGGILFQVAVNQANRLTIPYEAAADVFPATSSPTLSHLITEFPLTITGPGPNSQNWKFTYVCFDPEECFLLMKGWPEYSAFYKLSHMDTVVFKLRISQNHFLLEHQHTIDPKLPLLFTFPPNFPDENFLFEVEISRREFVCRNLIIPNELVRSYLPGYGAPRGVSGKQRVLRLTDCRDKDWYVVVTYFRSGDEYKVVDGWDVLVREHGLVDGDLVRFYKPEFKARGHHYLIQCVRKNERRQVKEEEEDGRFADAEEDVKPGPGKAHEKPFVFQSVKSSNKPDFKARGKNFLMRGQQRPPKEDVGKYADAEDSEEEEEEESSEKGTTAGGSVGPGPGPGGSSVGPKDKGKGPAC